MAKNKRTTLGMGNKPADWQVEGDLHTLMQARQIKSDPKRLERVKALAKEKMVQTAEAAACIEEKAE